MRGSLGFIVAKIDSVEQVAGRSLAQAHDEIVTNMDSYRAELPENCYAGAYIVDIAARIFDFLAPLLFPLVPGKRLGKFEVGTVVGEKLSAVSRCPGIHPSSKCG